MSDRGREIEIRIPGPDARRKLLHWASQFPHCVFLDSCGSEIDQYGQYDFVLGVSYDSGGLMGDADALDRAVQEQPFAWRFGYLGYDLKNEIEPQLKTSTQAVVEAPDLGFFEADLVVYRKRDSGCWTIPQGWRSDLMEEILATEVPAPAVSDFSGFRSNFSQEAYVATIQRLREHIREGDCYEINLTQNFSAKGHIDHPAALWEELTALSPVPFGGYMKLGDTHLLCASPERFLQLRAGRLLTQPIKGTAPRSSHAIEDAQNAARLKASRKEQAENVMIVDLSRHDLYKSAEVNSVEVEGLFEVQSFPKVHHLVSSIVARKRKDVSPVAAIKACFPPGSMTGAPKFRTCQLIDQYEPSARGIYSGSLGYFSPGGDFDLNVVIRSVVYDAKARRISYHVGGAITWDSDPEAEYQESLIKARAIRELFQKF